MTIQNSNYRLTIDWTYSSTANATTALGNINTALTNAGRAEVATRSGTQVTLLIVGIPDEPTATSLRDALIPAWSSAIRSSGRASMVRSNDIT